MATLDSLAGDQRAVLQLVLSRGRSYGDIASQLRLDPDSVRDRAVAALDALGPQTDVPDANRRLICDYLLGQLDPAEVPAARELLSHSAGDRAWARVLQSELAPLAAGSLPEIPSEADGALPGAPPAPAPALADGAAAAEPAPEPADGADPLGAALPAASVSPAVAAAPPPAGAPAPSTADPAGADGGAPASPRTSRRGGMLLIGVAVIVVIAAVVVLVFHHASNSKSPAAQASAPTTTAVTSNPGSSTETATTSASGSGSTRIISQINLSPTAQGSNAAAIADVLAEGSQREIAIVGQNVPPNTAKNFYAVWLYNSQTSAVRLGFVSPGVSANGKLSAAGQLPTNADQYKDLIVTLETSAHPSAPGPIVLEGAVSHLS